MRQSHTVFLGDPPKFGMAEPEGRFSESSSLPPLPEYPADSSPVAGRSTSTNGIASHNAAVQHQQSSPSARSAELHRRASTRSRRSRESPSVQTNFNLPDEYGGLSELAAPSPVMGHELAHRVPSLEDAGEAERERARARHPEEGRLPAHGIPTQRFEVEEEPPAESRGSRFATQLYTHAYLILFAMLGTWARLGMTRLVRYPGAPVTSSILWSNFAGSLFMGFLAEDQMLFRQGYGPRANSADSTNVVNAGENDQDGPQESPTTRKTRQDIKKSTPLYIGLATGFCGSFTSFSSLIRDAFLAMSNDLPSPDIGYPPLSRHGGESFMALLAVIITNISVPLSGLFLGSHLAIELERVTPTLPSWFTRKVLDRVMAVLGLGGWIAILFLSLFPPSTNWRGTPLLDLVFSPLGCLARFYLSILLNGKITGFPLGTFTANVLGTTLLGMFWDLTHLPDKGLAGCQVLTSLQDGFCGPLTTVSTLVLELSTLRRTHAYIYGAASVVVSLCMLIIIMGSLRWSQGFILAVC